MDLNILRDLLGQSQSGGGEISSLLEMLRRRQANRTASLRGDDYINATNDLFQRLGLDQRVNPVAGAPTFVTPQGASDTSFVGNIINPETTVNPVTNESAPRATTPRSPLLGFYRE